MTPLVDMLAALVVCTMRATGVRAYAFTRC